MPGCVAPRRRRPFPPVIPANQSPHKMVRKKTEPVKIDFGFKIRPMLRLIAVERRIRQAGLTVPSRPKLIQMVKDGIFEGKKTRFGFLVFEDSFLKWLERAAA